mgnify:CR=1 FL=1
MDFMTMMQTRKSIRSYEDKPVAREDLIKIVVGEDGMVTVDINEECTEETPYVLLFLLKYDEVLLQKAKQEAEKRNMRTIQNIIILRYIYCVMVPMWLRILI